MWFLVVLSWLSIVVQLLFVVLAVAAGLYYLAELVEEYTVVAAKVIRILVISCLVVYLMLFLFEDIPSFILICGTISHFMHLLVLRTFPYFNFSSIPLISAIGTFYETSNAIVIFLTVVLLFVNHYLAFSYFAEVHYQFTEVLGYFTVCLWLVPFAFFISLSANDNVLPTVAETRPLLTDDNDVVSHYFSRKNKKYGLLTFFNYAKDSLLPQRMKKSF
ncbi:hypothetical protein B4U80_04792 [Leptotrombidium deliense]|uniref:Protein TEX261 n=1 Tax=Leptotrombidium deliense TaxID=299467 RepID=A0A443SSL6_9ACAR|nr:hypothetical protein B4U80_04792 [Leptotrombidium deliense]